MFLRTFLVFIFSFFIFLNSFSQNTGVLKGTVTDNVTKESLPGATLQLRSNMGKGTATDLDGNYSITLDTGYHQLICNYIGFIADTFAVHISEGDVVQHNVS